MEKIITPRLIVIESYPDAKSENIGCSSGGYYNIVSDKMILGKGKSKKAAWKAAYNNIR